MKHQPKAFQSATVEAIISHYNNGHDRALCADEAGLGKTIVAAEVIRQMAENKIDPGTAMTNIIDWWKDVKDTDFSINGNKGNGPEYARYGAFKKFYETVCGEPLPSVTTLNKGNCNWKGLKSTILNNVENKLIQQSPTKEFVKKFLIAAAQLYQDCRTSQNEKKYMNTNDWKFPVSADKLPEPFRVLYICNSLALAEQNTRKLVTIPQNSYRSSVDKPDRLSTLWHYLQFKTPFLEIYPITATVTKTETKGTKREWELLQNQFECPNKDELRKKGEEKSRKEFKPDLVIFDEFQKFTDIINLIDVDDVAFDKYISGIKKSPQNEIDADENENADEEKNDRIEALERCRIICKGLFRDNKDPKILMLSATPFQREEETEKITEISIEELVKFMGGDIDAYKKAFNGNNSNEVERILYEDCGIFRTERVRLMKKQLHSFHIIKCSDEGIFSRAMSIIPIRNNKDVKGNRSFGISMNVPDLSKVNECYEDKYDIDINNIITELGKYKRLREIVLAPMTEDILDDGCRIDLSSTGDLNQLLWIPPVSPSKPLGGIFAKYRCFSKTIIFSNLKVIPVSISASLNKEMSCTEWNPEKDVEDSVKKGLTAILGREEWVDFVMAYLKRVGGTVLNEKNAYQVLKYCEDGCIADVMREWESQDSYPENYLSDDLNNLCAVSCNVEDTDLNAVGLSKRTCFNSPFYPFVLATTSIGAEGLDYHVYCNRMVHYTRPNNVIDLEQKNGRIDRYHSLAQRRFRTNQRFALSDDDSYKKLTTASGGMIPDWDAGECGIHYYFLCTEHTSDQEKLWELFDKHKSYRLRLGMPNASEPNSLMLSPFLKNQLP